MKRAIRPVSVDLIVKIGDQIVLVDRKYPPYGWALPGGQVEWDEIAEYSAMREFGEEVGLGVVDLKLFRVYSYPSRTPEQHITIVYTGRTAGTPRAGDDAKEVGVFNIGDLPETMAFDHRLILDDYLGEQSPR